MKIVSLKKWTLLVLALSLACCGEALSDPLPVPAAPTDTSAPAVRQSTPIPNDPEPKKDAKSGALAATAVEHKNGSTEAGALRPPSHRCFVRDLMAFYDRTHVRCYNAARGKISFFAVDTAQPGAETLLTKAWNAMRSGKALTITYAPTPDLNPTNCNEQNCRRLIDVLN